MPHYRNGVQAKEGDLVFGVTYNLHGRHIVGTMLEIIPGTDSCNCRVAFADVSTRPDATVGDTGMVYRSPNRGDYIPRVIKPGFDYGETREFELICRADGSRVPDPAQVPRPTAA